MSYTITATVFLTRVSLIVGFHVASWSVFENTDKDYSEPSMAYGPVEVNFGPFHPGFFARRPWKSSVDYAGQQYMQSVWFGYPHLSWTQKKFRQPLFANDQETEESEVNVPNLEVPETLPWPTRKVAPKVKTWQRKKLFATWGPFRPFIRGELPTSPQAIVAKETTAGPLTTFKKKKPHSVVTPGKKRKRPYIKNGTTRVTKGELPTSPQEIVTKETTSGPLTTLKRKKLPSVVAPGKLRKGSLMKSGTIRVTKGKRPTSLQTIVAEKTTPRPLSTLRTKKPLSFVTPGKTWKGSWTKNGTMRVTEGKLRAPPQKGGSKAEAPTTGSFSKQVHVLPGGHKSQPIESQEQVVNNAKVGVDKGLVLELAVFCDKECRDNFMPLLKTTKRLREAIFAIISQVQIFFRPPWLANPLEILVARLEIQTEHPNVNMSTEESQTLLEGFSKYQASVNPPAGAPGHWDAAVLLTGKNMYMTSPKGKPDKSVLGKAYVGGFCMRNFQTAIVEFGIESGSSVPSITSGFQTSHVVAHELAHNLGLHHDGPPVNKECRDDLYIMSEWRTRNTTSWWSHCSKSILNRLNLKNDTKCLQPPSAEAMREVAHLNEWKKDAQPGQLWDADQQCEVLLKDPSARKAAKPEDIHTICENLKCKTWHRLGSASSGEAFSGTYCGGNNWCQGGKCVPMPMDQVVVSPGGWSEWEVVGECQQACIEDSVALVRIRRFCNNPPRKNSLEGCEGDNVALRPCDISTSKAPKCKKLDTNKSYINKKCEYYSRLKPEIKPGGIQLPYERNQTWRACAIHCRYKKNTYIFAQFDLADHPNETATLPDGTRCNYDKESGAAYYCQHRQCATLLQSLAGIQDNPEGEVLDVLADDWAMNTSGRRLVEKYLEYRPDKGFGVLDKSKIIPATPRVPVDDAVEIPVGRGGRFPLRSKRHLIQRMPSDSGSVIKETVTLHEGEEDEGEEDTG